jgi:D-hydroxyproline dehydrogenase subunit beta
MQYLDDETYEVATLSGVFKAKTLVLAAGPWCRSLGSMLGLSIPVFAVRGQMWATGPVPPRIFHSFGAIESALYWHKASYSDEGSPLELTHRGDKQLTRHLYGRQTRDGEIIVGGDRQVKVAREPNPVGIESNRRQAMEIFPFLRDLPIKRTWSGWMPFTRDLRPVIGKIPHFKNLFILTGLSSSGFERGPMAGKLLADCIHNGVASGILSEADPAQQVTLQPA